MEKKLIGTHTALYIGGGDSGWITESYATCYRTFHKEIILADALKESDWTEWTAAQKTEWENNPPAPAPESAKGFIDQWKTAAAEFGTYNEATGYFELNGLKDITYQQALDIYKQTSFHKDPNYSGIVCRTNLPSVYCSYGTVNVRMYMCPNFEVFNAVSLTHGAYNGQKVFMSNCLDWFSSDPVSVIGILDLSYGEKFSTPHYRGHSRLRDMKIKGIKESCNNFGGMSGLSAETVRYMIANRAGDNAITLMFHPTVYAKIMDETNEEWYPILALAESKNVTIITHD